MPDASPVKWHLAHTTWFFETFLLAPNQPGYTAFDPAYGFLFNSYYNAVGDRHPRPERGMLSRPELDEILAYREHVDTAMQELIAASSFSQDLSALFELGLNHEQQHQELILMDVKHLLSLNPLSPAYQARWPLTAVRARDHEWIGFNARLPTEAEWEVAASGNPMRGNYLESGALHPLAQRESPAEGTLAQAFGDVWEWTRSDYAPYPSFRTAAGAIGEYNGKFMSGQYVLRGGSCVTPSSHVRATYRNFFPPETRWQFSGLRLARDADPFRTAT